MYPILIALLVGAVSAAGYFWSKRAPPPLPGSLETEGAFELEVDLSDAGVLEERKRDFCRMCAAKDYLQHTTVTGDDALQPLGVSGGSFDECAAQLLGLFGEESGARALTDGGAFAHVSATTPFEFAMKFGLVPNFPETRFVLVHDARARTFRVFWGAFISNQPTPPPAGAVWPFFVAFLSAPIAATGKAPPRATAFAYFCEPNAQKRLDKCVEQWFVAAAANGVLRQS